MCGNRDIAGHHFDMATLSLPNGASRKPDGCTCRCKSYLRNKSKTGLHGTADEAIPTRDSQHHDWVRRVLQGKVVVKKLGIFNWIEAPSRPALTK